MEANHRKPPQQEEHENSKAYALAVVDDNATLNKVKHLSGDDDDTGEPPENYRGWKAMPYVIGQCSLSPYVIPVSHALSKFKDLFLEL